MSLQVTRPVCNLYQFLRGRLVDTGFLGDDLYLQTLFRVIEVETTEALLGGLLQVLEDALVPGTS